MPPAARKPKAPQDHRSKVDGKVFVWTTEDGDTLTIPLRVKMKVIRSMSERELDAAGMFAMIEAIAPDQTVVIDEMDTNDFTAAFSAWQEAYNAKTGATVGESSDSST